MKLLNFGRNISLAAKSFYAPKNEQQVIEILDANKGKRIRCIGRLHSWSEVLKCDEVMLDLRHLIDVQLHVTSDFSCVQVGAGCQIKHLLEILNQQDWTLPSIGLITEQSIAGAISTGTHGSGGHSLSHYVTSLRVARYDRHSGKALIDEITTGDELRAAKCSLGCVGVILSVTMKCRRQYHIEEHFREYQQLGEVLKAEQDNPLQQFYLVPWRWTYMVQHRREVNAKQSFTSSLYSWYRFLVLDIAMHLLILLAVRIICSRRWIQALFRWLLPIFVIRNCRFVANSTTQLVMEHELFRHIEIELFVQRDSLEDALMFLQHALRAAGEGTLPTNETFLAQLEEANCGKTLEQLRGRYCHHYPICVRKILPDDTLISMASNAGLSPVVESCDPSNRLSNSAWYSITLTNYHRGRNRKHFDSFATFLAESMARLFHARPHWGKLCPLTPEELRSLYPAMGRFQDVCANADPKGVFQNKWVETILHRQSDSIT